MMRAEILPKRIGEIITPSKFGQRTESLVKAILRGNYATSASVFALDVRRKTEQTYPQWTTAIDDESRRPTSIPVLRAALDVQHQAFLRSSFLSPATESWSREFAELLQMLDDEEVDEINKLTCGDMRKLIEKFGAALASRYAYGRRHGVLLEFDAVCDERNSVVERPLDTYGRFKQRTKAEAMARWAASSSGHASEQTRTAQQTAFQQTSPGQRGRGRQREARGGRGAGQYTQQFQQRQQQGAAGPQQFQQTLGTQQSQGRQYQQGPQGQQQQPGWQQRQQQGQQGWQQHQRQVPQNAARYADAAAASARTQQPQTNLGPQGQRTKIPEEYTARAAAAKHEALDGKLTHQNCVDELHAAGLGFHCANWTLFGKCNRPVCRMRHEYPQALDGRLIHEKMPQYKSLSGIPKEWRPD